MMLYLSTSLWRKTQLLEKQWVLVKILLQELQGDSQITMKQEWSMSEIFNTIDKKIHIQLSNNNGPC